MSILRNIVGAFMPHPESRRTSGVLTSSGTWVLHALDGDSSVTIYLYATTGSFSYLIEGSADGSNFFPLEAYPMPQSRVGGSQVVSSTPLYGQTIGSLPSALAFSARASGLRAVRVRLTSGTPSLNVTITSDSSEPLNQYAAGTPQYAAYCDSGASAVGAALSLSLPVLSGFRHVIFNVSVGCTATTALTASATPYSVTLSGINTSTGAPVIQFGADAAVVGRDKYRDLVFPTGLVSGFPGSGVVLSCPAWPGTIWRASISYNYCS